MRFDHSVKLLSVTPVSAPTFNNHEYFVGLYDQSYTRRRGALNRKIQEVKINDCLSRKRRTFEVTCSHAAVTVYAETDHESLNCTIRQCILISS